MTSDQVISGIGKQVTDAFGDDSTKVDDQALAADLAAASQGDFSFQRTRLFWLGKALSEATTIIEKLPAEAQQEAVKLMLQNTGAAISTQIDLAKTRSLSQYEIYKTFQNQFLELEADELKRERGLAEGPAKSVGNAIGFMGWVGAILLSIESVLPDEVKSWAQEQVDRAKTYRVDLQNTTDESFSQPNYQLIPQEEFEAAVLQQQMDNLLLTGPLQANIEGAVRRTATQLGISIEQEGAEAVRRGAEVDGSNNPSDVPVYTRR